MVRALVLSNGLLVLSVSMFQIIECLKMPLIASKTPLQKFVGRNVDSKINKNQHVDLTYLCSKQSKIEIQSETIEEISALYKKDITQTGLFVVAALGFAGLLSAVKGPSSGIEFVSGYLLELCLSVDNLIVFILLFNSFQVGKRQQSIVLSYGIIGAIILRGLFIAVGAAAIQNFKQVLGIFAAILFYSSFQILFQVDEEDEDVSNNPVVKFAKKYLKSTEKFDGDKFFTEIDGEKLATPLLLCLVSVELSDVIFAFDSVPAIFGVTEDPVIVYTSNIFAICGLRALFGVLSTAVDQLRYLDTSVAVVLSIIATKLSAEVYGIELLDPVMSLALVVSVLGVGVGASLAFPVAADSDSDGRL